MIKIQNGVRAAAALIGLSVLLAGCGAETDSGGAKDAMKPAQTESEYKAEATTLTLAPGWSWPASAGLEKKGPDGAPVVYQRGYGKTRADWYWYCSWGRQFLATDKPKEDRARALQQMSKIRATFFYKVSLLPPDREAFEKILQKAELGDAAEATNDINLNCPAKSG